MIEIREMRREDKTEVVNMMRIFYTSPAVHTDGSMEIYDADVENCINENPYLKGYVFTENEEICGYAMIAKSFSTEFGKPCVWIEDIYFKPNYRGRGIFTNFLALLEEENPNVIIRLEAENDNEHAVHVYKKNGFKELPYLELMKEVM